MSALRSISATAQAENSHRTKTHFRNTCCCHSFIYSRVRAHLPSTCGQQGTPRHALPLFYQGLMLGHSQSQAAAAQEATLGPLFQGHVSKQSVPANPNALWP